MSDVDPLVSAVLRRLGHPWNAHGFDCWEFVRAVYADAFNIVLPYFGGEHQPPATAAGLMLAEAAERHWQECELEHGAILMLGKRDWPHHCGIYVDRDGGKIAHCIEDAGVVCQHIGFMRSAGWGFIKSYRFTP